MTANDFAIRQISELFAARTGQHLAKDRHWRIETALSSVKRTHRIASTEQLAQRLLLPNSQDLAGAVVDALLNNETYFFRDRAQFDQLARQVLPELNARRASERRLTIWSAGCSTGQEALSLAMILVDQWASWAGWSIEIVASDVSRTAIADAANGSYSAFQVQRGLGVHQILVHFEEKPGGWTAARRLRRMIRFEEHNLLDPPPRPGRFDLIMCRNVLLYFDAPTRTRALNRLADAMVDDGFLMLGGGETAKGHSRRLVPCSEHAGFYRPLPQSAREDARPDRKQFRPIRVNAGLGTT